MPDNNNNLNDEDVVVDTTTDTQTIEDDDSDDIVAATGAGGGNADYAAFSGQNAVRKVSRYGLTDDARAITKTYNGLFNGPNKTPRQIVYFGAPGTGKSYSIEKDLKRNKIDGQCVFRVIFHPDYSYGDFVGSIRPIKDDTEFDYVFAGGPMTNALKFAFENPHKDVYVIIEEINRGNAAAIFGDLFQLLDRDESGRSKYKILNKNICSVLCENKYLRPFFKSGKIWFPNNINFLCTMNTADQNVFILDSAFKRRFHMQYVKIDYEKMYKDVKLADYLDETDVFADLIGSKTLLDIFKDTCLEEYAKELDAKGRLKRNWPTFALLTNKLIDIINVDEGDQISEDKKLGPFYVLLDEIADRTMFADKVLYYLKQDVFKYIDNYFGKSYQDIYDSFVDDNADIFEFLVSGE